MIALFRQSFVVLRHGETEASRLDLVASAQDLPLTEEGLAQARRAAALLARASPAAIWCSSLRRARETAAAVAEATGLVPQVVPELAERDWGLIEGCPRTDAAIWRDGTPPGGEAAAAFHARTVAGLARIAAPWPALIVAHSGTTRVLAALLAPTASFHRLAPGEALLWRLGPDGTWTAAPLEAGTVT